MTDVAEVRIPWRLDATKDFPYLLKVYYEGPGEKRMTFSRTPCPGTFKDPNVWVRWKTKDAQFLQEPLPIGDEVTAIGVRIDLLLVKGATDYPRTLSANGEHTKI
jgi:hypothetical protein